MGRLITSSLVAGAFLLAACGSSTTRVEISGLDDPAEGTAFQVVHKNRDLDIATASGDSSRLIKQAEGAAFRDCEVCPQMIAVARTDSAKKIIETIAIGRTEITLDDWDACVAEGACDEYDSMNGGDKQDIVAIGRRGAEAFVAWLSKKSGQEYRVCTKIEWKRMIGQAPGEHLGFRVARDLE
jgi:hypothetical protein